MGAWQRAFLGLWLGWAGLALAAGGEFELTTGAGDTVPVRHYPAEGERLLLWLPGEHGLSPRQVPTAQGLAQRGIEVWQPDLHAAFFLPPGRYSLAGIEPGLIAGLIEAAVAGSGKRVFVAAPGRSAALALTGIRAWQAQTTHPQQLGGAVLLHPNLYRRTPQGGESGEYLPVTRASTVPIYLLQPDQSAAYWRVGELVAALESGGASVFLQRLRDAADGFNTRPDFDPPEAELTARLPAILDQALTLLAAVEDTAAPQALAADTLETPQREQRSDLLRPHPDPRPAPPLQLQDLAGRTHHLADLDGQVVLVNFWATWCPPCVEELPSLQRLYQQLHPDGLEILAVDVGESAEQVRDFLARKLPHTQVGFPVLLDPEGAAFKGWQAYAFPTTLILDRRHRIRYAVFGAFAWDSAEVVTTLRGLLAESAGGAPRRQP